MFRAGIPGFLRREVIQCRKFSASPLTTRTQYNRFGTPTGPSSSGKRAVQQLNLKLAAAVGVVGGVYYVSHLEQVPETGRWRFMNTGPKFEEEFGRTLRQQTLQQNQHTTLPPNHPVSLHVRRIVSQILAASNLGHLRGELPSASHSSSYGGGSESDSEAAWDPDARLSSSGGQGHMKEWDVIVVNDSKMVNAEAVPGLVIVYTGILPVAKDEQGLAAVLAHEIGHVVARHSAERISSQTIVFIALATAQFFGLDFGLSNLVQSLLYELPNSRTQELEADKIGLTLMSRACFDPNSSVEMFERMTRLQGQSRLDLSFLQTHPSGAKRIEALSKLLPDAYSVLAASPGCAAMQDQLQKFQNVTLSGRGGADRDLWE